MKFVALIAFLLLAASTFQDGGAAANDIYIYKATAPSPAPDTPSAVYAGPSSRTPIGGIHRVMPLRREPTPPYPEDYCTLSPRDFSVPLGTSMYVNATCAPEGYPADCPALYWESDMGLMRMHINITSYIIFTPFPDTGTGYVRASSTEYNFSCISTVTVLAGPLARIEVSPQGAYIPVGSTQQFSLLAFDSLNNTIMPNASLVDWSSEGNAGTMSDSGLFSATGAGSSTIYAEYLNFSANATIGTYVQPPSGGGSSGGSGGSGGGGAVGQIAGLRVQKECVGRPIYATVSAWGDAISNANVNLYLVEGNRYTLVLQATTDSNGQATLSALQEGNYEARASKDDLREGKQSFYLGQCTGGTFEPPQGGISLEPAAATLLFRQAIVYGDFVREFGVYSASGGAQDYTEVSVTYTNRATSPISDFEISETVPSSVYADARSMEFASQPRFASQNTFLWSAPTLYLGRNITYAYRIPRPLNTDMMAAFASPGILLESEKNLNATVGAGGGDFFASTAAALWGADGSMSQTLVLVGIAVLGIALAFAAYVYMGGKKSQEQNPPQQQS